MKASDIPSGVSALVGKTWVWRCYLCPALVDTGDRPILPVEIQSHTRAAHGIIDGVLGSRVTR